MLEGMSDVCTSEFVQKARAEFCCSDDPHTGSKMLNDCSILRDSHKKSCCETTHLWGTARDRPSDTYVDQERELGGFSTLSKRRNTMLEKDPLSQTPNVAFISASDSDPIKKASRLASENTMPSTHGLKSNDAYLNGSEFSGNDAIFSDKTNIVDNNSFNCQLGEINHTSSDLDFLGNAENKDPNDFLYYGWPEIENFEDIDGMLRSCDSTFDLELSKENESGWLPSADDLGMSGDVQKLDVKFPRPEPEVVKIISENHEFLNGFSINDTVMASAPIRCKDSSWTSENSNSCISFATGPATADREDVFIPQAQISINTHKEQMKLQHQSEGKSKEHCSGNGSFDHISDLPNEVMQLPSGLTSHQVFPSVHIQQKQNTRCPDSYNYLQNPISYVHSDNRHTHFSDPATVNLEPSPVKSETTDLTSVSLGNSSNASIQLQYRGSSHDPPVEITALAVCEQREKLHSWEGKCENRKDPEGVGLATPVELSSSNVQESSTMSLGLDDISPEAASFCQLQLVIEQLTSGMKLCIRDSLYRLAWSAEQRHNHANLNAGCGNGIDATSGAFVADGTNSFMYMETDTNPIDRSIAHLLFYRRSHSPPAPAHDSFPCKSRSVVHGSVASPALLVENSVSEDTVSEAEKVSD